MNQTLTVYHGSQQIVETPKFGVGKTYNDYGQGFYCTERNGLVPSRMMGTPINIFCIRKV